MKKMAVGIMSGTSLDGIDVVIASIEGFYKDTQIEIKAFKTYPFEEQMVQKIKDAMSDKTCTPALIASLHMELGYAFGYAAKKLCEENNIALSNIDFVASHGQTIWHINEDSSYFHRASLQLGEGSAIAAIMKTTVISNFRCADIAQGGVGAPLVPFVDYILFSDDNITRSLHNLGGISNMTILKAGGSEDDVIAFDTGPANMMINRAVQVLYQKSYDEDGKIARSGKVIKRMLDELMNHPYLKQVPPKSTGREIFGDVYTDVYIEIYKNEHKEDIIATLTHFTALSIIKAYQDFICHKEHIDEIIFSGGGAKNSYLLELIKKGLQNIEIKRLEDDYFDSQIKEALAFLILGNETLHHNPSNMLKATGAKQKAILGQINYFHK